MRKVRPYQRRLKAPRKRRPRWFYLIPVLIIIIWWWPKGKSDDQIQATNSTSVKNGDFVVFLHPGDGGEEWGAIYPPDSENPEVKGKDINLQIAQAAQRALAKEGIKGVLSREGDTFVDALDRKERSEQAGAVVSLAIYVNSNFDDPALAGIEIIDYKQVDWPEHYKQRVALARELERAMTERMHGYGLGGTGVFTRNSAFVADMPTLVLLPGFISNDIERERLQDEQYQWEIANAITDAMVIYRDKLQKLDQPPADIKSEDIIRRLHIPY